MDYTKLYEIGEFNLLNTIVIPKLSYDTDIIFLGDDCSFINLPTQYNKLVITSDTAPRPLVWHLGDKSYYTWGWYSVIVNASDLATSGADPLAFTSMVDAHQNMYISDFEMFFEGMRDAMLAHNLLSAGGNIRAAPNFGCHCTAIGTIPDDFTITRKSAKPGDYIFSLGNNGEFAASYILAKYYGLNNLSDEDINVLYYPYIFLKDMSLLREKRIVHSASDNSDGLLGALWNIAESSDCTIKLENFEHFVSSKVKDVALRFNYNPVNLSIFWGDWQIVAVVSSDMLELFYQLIPVLNSPINYIGKIVDGPANIISNIYGYNTNVNILRSENFSSSSFNDDIFSNIESMLTASVL